MREFTGEADDDASAAASGVHERDHKTIPPGQGQLRIPTNNKRTFMRNRTVVQHDCRIQGVVGGGCLPWLDDFASGKGKRSF